MVSNCEFVTFPLVSCVRCGTLLYRFLIFAPLLTLTDIIQCWLHIGHGGHFVILLINKEPLTDSVLLSIILIKNKVDQKFPSSYYELAVGLYFMILHLISYFHKCTALFWG